MKLNPRPEFKFCGYNPHSTTLLPRQLNLSFPTMFTHKLAIDKTLLDLMRPLFDGGLRPHRFQKMILELHHKQHIDLSLLHECSDVLGPKHEQISSFNDRYKYDYFVPSPRYFQQAYLKNMKSLRLFLDNEMKKYGGDVWYIDGSHTGTKNL